MSGLKERLTKRVKDDRGDPSPASVVLGCLLQKLNPEVADVVTVGMIQRVCGSVPQGELYDIMMYFSSDAVALFRVEFGYYTDEGDLHTIPVAGVREHLRTFAPIIDPETGNPIPDPEDLVVRFRATATLRAALEERQT